MRFCVVSEKEQRKCQDLRMVALARRVLPEITCIRGSTTVDCMDRIRRGEADMRTFDSNDAYRAGRSVIRVLAIFFCCQGMIGEFKQNLF